MESNNELVLTSDQYKKLLKFAGGNPRMVLKLPQVRNKKIIINGSLNLSGFNINNLDGIVVVRGSLDISDTKITNIDHINVISYVHDLNTPRQAIRLRKIRSERIAELEHYKANDEFDIDNNTELSNKVNALYKYFINKEIVNPNFEDEILNLESNLEELRGRLETIEEDTPFYDSLLENINDIESVIDDIRENNFGLYSIYPLKYKNRFTNNFIVVEGSESIAFDKTFIVLDSDECSQYAREYVESFVDELDITEDVISYYVDGAQVREYFKETIEEWVRESPESYLDDDDKELSSEQIKQIQILRDEAESIERKLYELEDGNEMEEEFRERLDEIESEIEEIEDDKSEYSEDAIENYVEDWLDRIEKDPSDFLSEFGFDKKFLSEFIDKDAWINDIIRNDGEESYILHGEGPLDEIIINGDYYSIYYEDGSIL